MRCMVRFLVLYGMPVDPAEFERHYREVHIPLAKQLPGLRRYSISRGPLSGVRGGEPFHLIAELDWDDMDALRAAFASPIGQATGADVPLLATGGVRSMIYELEDL
jgi:uncharacterized protein (TIGR02118 family)